MKRHRVTIIPGDGIGPEISDAVVKVLAAAGAPIDWEYAEAGLGAIEKGLPAVPQTTLDAIKRNRVAIKGPTTTPIGGGHQSANVTLRKALDLYANVRPSKNLPGLTTPFPNVNLLIVRENTEDLYAGIEHYVSPNTAQSLKVITRQGSTRVARYAFETARALGRKKLTCVHKANIMKLSDGLFLECAREVAQDYPEIEFNDVIVDALCMQLVTNPARFDVLLLPNLYGDIVSDLCAGLVGGLGVAPGGNIGEQGAVFEAVHGSAPDIAGQGLANPTAMLLSAVMMLHHLGEHELATRVEQAVDRVLSEGKSRTRDLGGTAKTEEYVKAIVDALAAQPAAR